MNIILPLSITLTIETGIYMILKHRDIKLFVITSLLNAILNVAMNVSLSSFTSDMTIYWVLLSAFEVMTILIESLVITFAMKIGYLKVLLFSFIANLTSFLVGLGLSNVINMKITPIIISVIFVLVYLITFGVVLFSTVSRYRNRDNDCGGDKAKENNSTTEN